MKDRYFYLTNQITVFVEMIVVGCALLILIGPVLGSEDCEYRVFWTNRHVLWNFNTGMPGMPDDLHIVGCTFNRE